MCGNLGNAVKADGRATPIRHIRVIAQTPYDVSLVAPTAQSAEEAFDLWVEAYEASKRLNREDERTTGLWLAASKWETQTTSFDVVVDLSELLDRYGDGVYTVVLWGRFGDESDSDIFSQYSVWYGIEPPDTYRQTD